MQTKTPPQLLQRGFHGAWVERHIATTPAIVAQKNIKTLAVAKVAAVNKWSGTSGLPQR